MMTPRTKYFIPVFIATLQLSCGNNVDADKNQASLTDLAALNRDSTSLDSMQDILLGTFDISQVSNDGVEELAVTVQDLNDELERQLDALEKFFQQAISAAVHDLSGKLNDSQQRIQDLEANSKQLKFKVQNLSIRLEDSQRKVEELQDNVEQLTLKVASQNKMVEGMRECIQQQKIKELMEEFKKTKDWPAIVTGLKHIIYNDSEAYTQLQNIDVTLLSPLHQIAILGYTELASLLLAGGLPVDTAIDSDGSTLLAEAALLNQLPLVKLLILHGADINDKQGPTDMTPLMWAAASGSLDVVKWLVSAGADVTITTRYGRTALDEARFWGQQEVVKFLERINAVLLEDRIQSP